MTKDTGGMAFPNPALADEAYSPADDEYGMSLRDYFAAKALLMDGLGLHADILDGQSVSQHMARAAYNVADAMLEARK